MSALAQSADELEVGRRSAGGQLPRVWFGLGAASTLGLLTYPLPTAWLGLAGLVALALARWHRLGSPLPPTRLNLVLGLYLAGALIGLIVSTRSSTAEVRFFGVLAAIGAFLLVLETRNSPNSLGRLTHGALLLAVVLMALVFLLVAPRLQ